MINKILLIGSANISKILIGFCLLKLASIYLTTSEFGRLGHYISFISLLFVFSGGGLTNGIIALVGQNRNNQKILQSIESTLLTCSFTFAVLLLF